MGRSYRKVIAEKPETVSLTLVLDALLAFKTAEVARSMGLTRQSWIRLLLATEVSAKTGVPVADLCRKAQVNRRIWKAGVRSGPDVWERVEL